MGFSYRQAVKKLILPHALKISYQQSTTNSLSISRTPPFKYHWDSEINIMSQDVKFKYYRTPEPLNIAANTYLVFTLERFYLFKRLRGCA